MAQAVSVGEVMVELARGPDGRFALGYGGDTFNTAVYLARLGVDTAYATALGEDRYSDGIIARAADEGVSTELVLREPGRVPGLYLIETDKKGERTFHYWRDTSPARELFELPGWERVAEAIVTADLVYFSGITLSLYSNAGIGRLLATLEYARQRGAKIAFDSNYRPARLEERRGAGARRVRRGADARRYRIADFRGRGAAVGRRRSELRPSSACAGSGLPRSP